MGYWTWADDRRAEGSHRHNLFPQVQQRRRNPGIRSAHNLLNGFCCLIDSRSVRFRISCVFQVLWITQFGCGTPWKLSMKWRRTTSLQRRATFTCPITPRSCCSGRTTANPHLSPTCISPDATCYWPQAPTTPSDLTAESWGQWPFVAVFVFRVWCILLLTLTCEIGPSKVKDIKHWAYSSHRYLLHHSYADPRSDFTPHAHEKLISFSHRQHHCHAFFSPKALTHHMPRNDVAGLFLSL